MTEHDATEIAYNNGKEAGKPKWIPAKERLPEEFVSVLIYVPKEFPLPTVIGAYRVGKSWVSMMETYYGNEVTHWMSMPEPPKEKV